MKKIIIITLAILIAFSSGYVFALDVHTVETSVKINGEYLYSDTAHVLNGDTVFVVGKYLVEGLGGNIEWFEETKIVKITLDEKVIELQINSDLALVDGEVVELHRAPYLVNGRTMLPLKFISENFGCQVVWQQDTYTVEITKEGLELPENLVFERAYTDEDLYYLSKIVTVESGDKSFEMALAIANTVINRVEDPRFPNSVKEVIYQVDKYKQFPPAHKESFKTLEPSWLATLVSKRALEGVNNIGNSLFFNNQPFKSKTDDLIKIIDGEYFYN